MKHELLQDLERIPEHTLLAALSNRGFHALLTYRIAHRLWKYKIPLLPQILTRIIQILYAIDIDYRAQISGGVLIIHGVGLVIGAGARVSPGTTLYHGVTLGVTHSKDKPGFPELGRNVLVGAGAKLLGGIKIGDDAIVGANAVVLSDVPPCYLAVGCPARVISRADSEHIQ